MLLHAVLTLLRSLDCKSLVPLHTVSGNAMVENRPANTAAHVQVYTLLALCVASWCYFGVPFVSEELFDNPQ